MKRIAGPIVARPRPMMLTMNQQVSRRDDDPGEEELAGPPRVLLRGRLSMVVKNPNANSTMPAITIMERAFTFALVTLRLDALMMIVPG